jgi:hypothetical protein
MAETSQYVDEAIDVLHALKLGRSNGLSPYLFQRALEELGPGNPQICGPLRQALVSPDDINVRLRVLDMIAKTGHGWVQIYGIPFADEIVLSIADSNIECAANACHAVQNWDPGDGMNSVLLLWGKRHLPGLWEIAAVQVAQLPPLKLMLQELPTYETKLLERRELPTSTGSMENNVRLFGKFKGTMMSVFSRS